MTTLNKVFMLPADARLNRETMRAILASGHSRIPVYTRGDRCAWGPQQALLHAHTLLPDTTLDVPLVATKGVAHTSWPCTLRAPSTRQRHCMARAQLMHGCLFCVHRSSIIGLILVKELLQYKTHQEVPVSDVRMRSLPR